MKRVVLIASVLMGGCTVSPNYVSDRAMNTATLSQESKEVTVSLPDSKLRKLAHEVAQEVDKKLAVRNNGILTKQPPPPYADAYPNLRRDNIAFYDYVDDFNWYMNYLFSYTIVLNDYAESRGWKHPDTIPICRVVNWQVMEELPRFQPKSDPSNDLSRFEWELVDYIKTIKDKYQDESDELDTIRATQRILCVY